MKSTVALLLVAIYPSFGGALGQDVKLNIELNHSDFSRFMEQVKEQSDFTFFFNDASVMGLKDITVSLRRADIESALKACLKGSEVDFRIRDKTIVLFVRNAQQPREPEVKGRVVDAAGAPLVGATIKVVDGKEKATGPLRGTTTDANGNFTLRVQAEGVSLEFSFVGYVTRVLPADGARALALVTLQEEVGAIEEVVVTGMVRVDRRLFTGATDHLRAEDMKIDGLPDISRSLEGRSAGVSVQNISGTFGTAPKIRIRGATSIYGSSRPLWVVDGVIMEDVVEVDADALSSGDAETLISSAIAGLNADDIESFQILKDGSATSIYGARAMSGVIVVTTKRGKKGASDLKYTGEFTTRLIPDYSGFDIMNSQDQMDVYKELEAKGWLTFSGTFRDRNSGVYGKMYQLMNTYDEATGTYALLNTEEAKNAYLRRAEMRNTNWFKELFRLSLQQNHSLSMSGGTDKTNYYASLSAMIDPGWTIASSVNRYTGILNSTFNIRQNLSLNLITNASYRKQSAPGTLGQENDVVRGEVTRNFDINPYSYALNASRTMDASEFYTRNYAPFNIHHELKNNYMDLNVVDLKFQGEVKWRIRRQVELAALGAMKYTLSSLEHHIKDESNQAMAYRAMPDAVVRDANPYLYTDPDNLLEPPISVLPQGGIYKRTDNLMVGYDFRGTASWDRDFNNVHIMKLFGGTEINYADRQRVPFTGWGRQYSMGDVVNYAYEVFKQSKEGGSGYYEVTTTRTRSAAFFAFGAYSYMSKYTFNGTLRYEGTNKLGKARSARWLPTWNLAGAWNIHEEEFYGDALKSVLSHAKLKASYSLTGDRGPSFVTNSKVVLRPDLIWRPQPDQQETKIYISRLENSDLTYEKKHELNVGLDLGFLDNRVNLSVDWYRRANFDLIGEISTLGIGGEVEKYANNAEMKSDGFEATLSTKNIKRAGFAWNTDFIFSYTHARITQLYTRKRVYDFITNTGFGKIGYPHRALFSIPFMGLDKDGVPTFLDQDHQVTTTNVYFQEREKLDFLKYEGPTEPTIFGSLGNIFTYKTLRLNVFITYSFGNKVRLDRVFRSGYSDIDAMPKEFKNRWVAPGDEAFTNVPVILATRQTTGNSRIVDIRYGYNSYNFSNVRVADGGFVRMKEVSLSYELPKAWLADAGFKSLSMKLQGTNLFLIYADKKLNGHDPEFFHAGGVSAPLSKQFTFTLRFGI
ncbi:MAG: SusC/RagA family TonB-linked outer membrane protein [Odoribacteraceae bacterium]|jgi:TonB-linked SusC/RagA family outer membrane protein|nr:SusC/RagA family TonB-linked outer membrane protein [Odoribacteraceae bacterium]